VRITSAYGAMREVEILHDTLLDRFQRYPTLQPRDVLVMSPQIERYAPAIEAVFGAAAGARFIPWTITDLSRRGTHPLVAAVEQLLRLPDSRFAASEVLGLLETPAIARRFGFDSDSLGLLREALHRARLHGGLDAAQRAARGLPEHATHTWQFALQRLFLGVAMGEQEAPVLGVLPEPAFEGQATAALGRLQRFIDALAQWQQRLARAQVPDQWVACLYALADDFFDADDNEQAVLDDVLKAARSFLDEANAGGFEEELAPIVFRSNFLARLEAPASRGNLRTGGVVFCGMMPMRSLPYRVIALLGMNSDAFPRQQRAPGFDLITLAPQAGDRSRRHDDRHLFLETLLSARDALYISYTGRSLQDNSAKEPSVLVRELLDQVVATHGGESARKHIESLLVTEHPLQPFSSRYFTPPASGEPALFTCDPDWLLPAQGVAASAAERPPFLPAAAAGARGARRRHCAGPSGAFFQQPRARFSERAFRHQRL
jgi:exodeoxyribonuclease V gamma subunit